MTPNSQIAVVLNRHARRFRPKLLKKFGSVLSPEHLYVSGDFEHSRQIARTLIERQYRGVLVGGGDGTFVRCVTDIAQAAQENQQPLPQLGILRLGTGNALADTLGASKASWKGLFADLKRAQEGTDPMIGVRTLSLLKVENRLTPFAGCGFDAQVIADFNWLKNKIDSWGGPLAKPTIGPAIRYALASGLISIPRYLFGSWPEIELVNRGKAAYRIDWQTGEPDLRRPVAYGEILYSGKITFCAASTIPYYGLGLKAFPFVNERLPLFQLRLSNASMYESVRHLPAVFRGIYRTPRLYDFLCESVEVRLKTPTPVQVGGDLLPGKRSNLTIEMASPIEVLA